MATTAQRRHVAEVIRMLHTHRALLDYPPDDQRTNRDNFSWHLTESQALHAFEHGDRLQMDCSETGSWELKCAGLWHWWAPGYTGSHLATLRPIYTDARLALTGAVVVFGGGTGHHEALVLEPDAKHGNPLLGSHGRPGYDLVRLHDLAREQAGLGHPGVRFLSIAHL